MYVQEVIALQTGSDKMVEVSHNKQVNGPLTSSEERLDIVEPLLTEAWKLEEWNATQQEYCRDVCVPQLVALRAIATPDAIAITERNQVLSYKELNERANQLAHNLQKRGVGPNVLAALCVKRSLNMVIGLLGILKAGGAYVPLDSSYPPERLLFMLEDAQVSVLVTEQSITESFAIANVQTIHIDADAGVLAEESKDEPEVAVTNADLAYVVYTSGSTGRPKGVQIKHDSLLNLVYWHQKAFEITAADRATQLTSPAFDATGWELWPYLTAGASVHLVDEDTRVSPTSLRDWLLSAEITVSFLPTALAESVIALQWPEKTPLRILLTGADTLRHYPPAALPFALINNYGPSEATVVATSGRIFPDSQARVAPSIGRPIANTQIYILDEQLQQVAIGEIGELYIGGSGLAAGYLHRPELTSERFIVNPFGVEEGSRLYKTGDLASYRPDGQILFMGRSDDQIKIRGFRIEPDEITSVMNRQSSIQTSLVIAREDTPGEKRLVAYLVLADDEDLTVDTLREALREQLPDYMIPSAFVVLDALPITPNGKIDRKALPAPDETNTMREQEMALPNTPTEERVSEIVTSLLNLERIGVDENFFLLGGHSLLGTQLITRIGETFGVELSLRTLFSSPTIQELSFEIEQLILAKLEAMSDEEAEHLLQ